MLKRYTLLLYSLLTVFLVLVADNGLLHTPAEGLSASTTNSIIQDNYGYIWIGTEYGLNRYDGYHFSVYHAAKSDTTSLPSNEITALFLSRDKQLWVGCSKGLARYDARHNRFVRYRFPDTIQPRVESIVETANGQLLLGTAGYGLFAIDKIQNKAIRLKAFSRGQDDEFASKLFLDHQGVLWRCSHNNMISRWTLNGLHPRRVTDFRSDVGPVMSYIQRPHGVLMICMYGILYYDEPTASLSHAGSGVTIFDKQVSVRKGIADRQGNLFIGSSGHGLFVIRKGSSKLESVTDDNSQFNLSAANVNDIYQDRDGNLWVSCYKKGIYLISHKATPFRAVSFANKGVRLGSSVSSIAADGKGGVWCVVQKAGIYHFSADGTVSGRISAPESPNTLWRSADGHYWLGTENALWSYDPNTGARSCKLQVQGWGINAIADAGRGILAVSNFGKGLLLYNPSSGHLRQYSMAQNAKGHPSLVNDWVRTMLKDHQGLLWIGTADGLACMDPVTGSFSVLGWQCQLRGIQVYALCENRRRDILVGTTEGLFVYNRQHRTTRRMPDDTALRNVTVYGIVEDHSGDLWLSTTDGIWQYDHRRHRFIGHIHGNGLASAEYIPGAAIHSDNDDICFATSDGLTMFTPQHVRHNTIRLRTVSVTRLTVNGEERALPFGKLKLSHNENNLSFDFSLFNYTDAADIIYQYRINDQQPWMSLEAGVNRLTLGEMKPGTYHIEARAVYNGQMSTPKEVITVVIRQPWYATLWAFLVYALVAVGIVVAVLYYVERKRAIDLEDQKMQFLINATHDIRSPLTLILAPLAKLRQTLSGTPSENDVNTIDRNAKRLLLLVNQILDERKLDKNQMRLQYADTDMVASIQGVCAMFQYNARERHITLNFEHADKELWLSVDPQNFEKVLINLLSNAFKYTPDGGEICFRLTHDETSVVVNLLDTGCGFSGQEARHVFERFYQGRNHPGKHLSGTGIGLNLCQAIVKMHGGTILAANRQDGRSGACMTVTLPYIQGAAKPQHPQASPRQQANRGCRVMLVDDDTELTQYIANELGKWYRFDVFANGRDALQALLTDKHYDVVISDIIMPVMDGIELLKRIKGNPQINDVPVVMLTSKGETVDRLQGISSGADAYMEKPFSMEELHAVIDNLVDNVRRLKGKYSGTRDQVENIKRTPTTGNNEQLMDRVMQSVNNHLADPEYSVETLTADVGISRAQLHRKMKELTGISTAEFIRNIRMQRAAELIEEGKINITQIAYDCGFNSQSHFSTAFRKHFGITPSQYAAQHTSETNRNEHETKLNP